MVEQRELILRERGPTIGVAHRRRRRSCVALIHTDHAVAIAQRGTRIPWHAIPEVVGGAHPAGSDEQYRETVAFDLVVEPDRSAFEHRHGHFLPDAVPSCGTTHATVVSRGARRCRPARRRGRPFRIRVWPHRATGPTTAAWPRRKARARGSG